MFRHKAEVNIFFPFFILLKQVLIERVFLCLVLWISFTAAKHDAGKLFLNVL